MNTVREDSPPRLQDPFHAEAVWRGIDAQLRRDLRRASIDASPPAERGQSRMRDVFVRRASEEADAQALAKNRVCKKAISKLKAWLRLH